MTVRELITDWLDARCPLCRLPAPLGRLCVGCVEDLPRQPAVCRRCALPVTDASLPCGRCQQRPPPFAALIAPLHYRFPLDQLITRLKFGRELALVRSLAPELVAALKAEAVAVDAVVAVPLHWRRLLWRGFNQADELAAPVAKALGRPHLNRALVRVRATAAQTGLGRVERRRNLRRAFAVRSTAIRGRRILLVDDVVTSAATLTAASRALLQAGASAVVGAALARAY